MRLVVADTSPLNYLVLIGQVEILPALFERIFVPQTVQNELRQNEAPESGAAILLATQIGADLLLIDDRDGVNVARSRGFAVTGTLGILDLAATRGLIRLNEAVEHLKNTSFRYPPDVLDALLARHSPKGKS